MILRKKHFIKSSAIWSITPDHSPQPSPVLSVWDMDEESSMSGEEFVASRPISLTVPPREDLSSPGARPVLEDVLNDKAPPPHTLSAFMAFLSQQHCLEVLEFTMEAEKYRKTYEIASSNLSGNPVTFESDEGFELQQHWTRILDIYIKPGAPREINLPSEERDDLVDCPYEEELPLPEALDPAVKKMKELMSDSIFIPFCNQFSTTLHSHTYHAPFSDFGPDDRIDPSRSTYDGQGHVHHLYQRTQSSSRRKSPPPTSNFEVSTPKPSPNVALRPNQSSLSSALGRAATARLSTQVSNSSAASAGECALTEDSVSGESPGRGEPMTPPTTPPSSDLGLASPQTSHILYGSHAPHTSLVAKPSRSDSGNWRKMGMKLWGKKKNNGSVKEQPDES